MSRYVLFLWMLFDNCVERDAQLPKIIVPSMVVLQPDQTDIAINCKVKSLTEAIITWGLEQNLTDHLDFVGNSSYDSSHNCTTYNDEFYTNYYSNNSSEISIIDSILVFSFDIDSPQCRKTMRNITLHGNCIAKNEFGSNQESFSILIPISWGQSSESQFFSILRWWKATKQQLHDHKTEKLKAFYFVLGMIPPLGILIYIAFYLSCFRNAVHLEANMFGSDVT